MPSNSAKCKNMMYTQQLQHLPAKSMEKLAERIEKRLGTKKYAAIMHDKDLDENGNPVSEHIHAMLSFDNARSLHNVAKLLGDKPQYLEAWHGNSNNGYAYLCHRTQSARDKFQYDPNIVVSNFDYPALLDSITAEIAESKSRSKSKTDQLLDALYEGNITRDEIEHFLSGSQYAKNKRHIDSICAKRLERLAIEWRNEMKAQGRQVRVIWLYGTAGTGKTSLAKDYAQKAGQDYYLSGSSRDLFQGYAGQHTIILDEFRPTAIPYHDLLRLLDPFGLVEPVAAPSRYYDKSIAADLIIITTPYSPLHFYKEIFGDERNIPQHLRKSRIDGFPQLERRVSLAIEMNDYFIHATQFDKRLGKYDWIDGTSRPNPYSGLNRPQAVSDPVKIYDSMFD